MSQQPTNRGLSQRLKYLQHNEAPLTSPGFTLDDVVRGGRRRQRRRTTAQVAAAVVAVAALGTGIALPQLRGDRHAAPPAVTATSTAPRPVLPAINLAEDKSLTYKMSGKNVTVTRKGVPVTTITLQSASYTSTSGHIVFQFTAVRALTVDTNLFVLYDANGGENTANKPTKIHMDTGTHALTLDFRQTRGNPEAVGWAPSDGEAVWERTN
jgi:hypothetical protein